MRKNIVYALYLFSITIISLEIILRIYNPFHFRIKGEKIILTTFLSKKSERCNTVINLLRLRKAAVNRLADTYIELKAGASDSLIVTDQEISSQLIKQKGYLEGYKKRVMELVQIWRNNRIHLL